MEDGPNGLSLMRPSLSPGMFRKSAWTKRARICGSATGAANYDVVARRANSDLSADDIGVSGGYPGMVVVRAARTGSNTKWTRFRYGAFHHERTVSQGYRRGH